jgi:protein O-GlcNAc transferase
VGSDPGDMVRIAKHLGSDPEYRAALRDKVANNRLQAPLFDTARFTRDFESAIEMMVERNRRGLPVEHIDVPDEGPVESHARAPKFLGRVSALQTPYSSCPLCAGASVTLGFANCTTHRLWHEPLPPSIEWMQCPSCGHVHNRRYWTDAGLAEVRGNEAVQPLTLSSANLEARRAAWAPVVEKVVGLLGGYRAVVKRETRPIWVDVGCGDGTLIMTAADSGMAVVGLETRAATAARIRGTGINALQHDFLPLKFEVVLDVLSMMDVLDQIPSPREALRKAAQVLRPGGVLVISTPDMTSSSWKVMEAEKINPYLMDLERHHIFSRDRLLRLLNEHDFEIMDFRLAHQTPAQFELYASKR